MSTRDRIQPTSRRGVRAWLIATGGLALLAATTAPSLSEAALPLGPRAVKAPLNLAPAITPRAFFDAREDLKAAYNKALGQYNNLELDPALAGLDAALSGKEANDPATAPDVRERYHGLVKSFTHAPAQLDDMRQLLVIAGRVESPGAGGHRQAVADEVGRAHSQARGLVLVDLARGRKVIALAQRRMHRQADVSIGDSDQRLGPRNRWVQRHKVGNPKL